MFCFIPFVLYIKKTVILFVFDKLYKKTVILFVFDKLYKKTVILFVFDKFKSNAALQPRTILIVDGYTCVHGRCCEMCILVYL